MRILFVILGERGDIMKNNVFKICLSICLLVATMLSLTGCLNYGTSIEFETWGGTQVATKHFEFNSTIVPADFQKPSKTGYTFLSWYYDDNFEQEVVSTMVAQNMNVKYYARYEVNETLFKDTSTYFAWGNDNTALTIENEGLLNSPYYFEIDKSNGLNDFNSISISPMDETAFIINSIEVSDENGKPLVDIDSRPQIFSLERGVSGATKFVVKVTGLATSAIRIVIN